jgi:hypothetical protein
VPAGERRAKKMTIKELMKIGTNGMTDEQKDEELARRLKVAERINKLAESVKQIEGLPDDKALKNQKKSYARKLKQIKADESVWLKQAAWFMYA